MSRFWGADEYQEFNNANAFYHENTIRLLHGKRGQVWLKEIEQALLALPKKRLIANQLAAVRCDEITGDAVEVTGVCAVGAYALFKGKTAEDLNHTESDAWEIAQWAQSSLGLHNMLAQWLEWANDEEAEGMSEFGRYVHVLAKVRYMIHG